MNISRSELRTLLARAARGAGVPVSQSEELAAMLSCQPAVRLNDLLAAVEVALDGQRSAPTAQAADGTWRVEGGDPLQSIPAALDLAEAGERAIFRHSALAGAWAAHRGFAIDAEGALQPAEPAVRMEGRLGVADHLLDVLKAWAARTFVPATDESRTGAGAGDIDND